jgi:hypothetical protein
VKRILLLAFLFLSPCLAGAAYYDTAYLKSLINNCNSLPETFDAKQENFVKIKDCGLSTGYILGIYDALNVMADSSKCLPATLPSAQAVAVVEKWINSHPEHAHDSADNSVRAAMNEAWSCPGR